MMMAKLSTPRTDRLYPTGNILGTHFCEKMSRPQGLSAPRKIMSMTNSHDTIGNKIRTLPAHSAVPQPKVPG